MKKVILDACCGSRMFWFNKQNPHAVFVDKRDFDKKVIWQSKDGTDFRTMEVKPDIVADFRSLPFDDESFYHVVFDPPHLLRLGETSWLAAKYGKLDEDWREMIGEGFRECMRVLKPYGTLIFKWNETDISTKDVIKVCGQEPLYGHRSGKHDKIMWMAFMKMPEET